MEKPRNKALAKPDCQALSKAFLGGDQTAGEQLKEHFPENHKWLMLSYSPHKVLIHSLKREYGKLFKEGRLVAEEATGKRIAEIRTGLSPQNMLEILLVERIIVCYLESNIVDLMIEWEGDRERTEVYCKRQGAAHRRYLAAIKALAQVRKLQLPAIQVNIGEKQINTVGSGVASA